MSKRILSNNSNLNPKGVFYRASNQINAEKIVVHFPQMVCNWNESWGQCWFIGSISVIRIKSVRSKYELEVSKGGPLLI